MNRIDPCAKSDSSELLSLDQALEQIFVSVKPVTGKETLNLKDGLGRIIAEDIESVVDIPPHRNSSMDGYAFNSRDVVVSKVVLPVPL